MIEMLEFIERRKALLASMLPNSIAVIPAAQLVTRSNDTEYAFRQDSNFHYLSGFPEPDALLVLSNNPALTDEPVAGQFSALFCLPKDKMSEIWQGRRIGPDLAQQKFEFDVAHGNDELDIGLESYIDGHDHLYFARGQHPAAEELIDSVLQQLRNAPKQSKTPPNTQIDIRDLINEMRLIKSSQEIAIMRQAAQISCTAHKRAMSYSAAGRNEFHLEAEIHHSFAMQGAKHPAYGTIVGSGDNACILHYTENSGELHDGDLVLIDAGAELQGYAADITRTFPVSGQFTEPQKQLYQLVLDAQLASFALFKPGNTLKMATDCAIEVITEGLITLGILTGTVDENIEKQHFREYFMHGLSHWLGLDVHDVGNYKIDGQERPLKPGMTLTVEPGIYIAKDAAVDAKWRGIGIRIEDNLLITDSGYEVLTQDAPKTIEEIEIHMAKHR